MMRKGEVFATVKDLSRRDFVSTAGFKKRTLLLSFQMPFSYNNKYAFWQFGELILSGSHS